jgi:hypothetical protein
MNLFDVYLGGPDNGEVFLGPPIFYQADGQIRCVGASKSDDAVGGSLFA